MLPIDTPLLRTACAFFNDASGVAEPTSGLSALLYVRSAPIVTHMGRGAVTTGTFAAPQVAPGFLLHGSNDGHK